MEMDSPYDEWSKNIHAVITFLKPFFDDWRSYASLVSALLGIGVLIMENQVLLRMRMGRWEVLGYILWCIVSSLLGPIVDIVLMLGLLAYCRHKSAQLHITNEAIAKALLPPPVASNYRVMGAVCSTASILTLCSNVLYMLRGWEHPLPFYDWSSKGIRWMTSQIWYAIGMIFLFHVVTRPAQSGVVLFGKFPRDLWSLKWYICILYFPVRYMLLSLCDVHRDSRQILIPLEIIVDVVLYNGPFLAILLRLLYLAWQVAYDEAVLTGAIYEDESTGDSDGSWDISALFFPISSSNSSCRRVAIRPGTSGYVGLAVMDLDEAEQGQSRVAGRGRSGRNSPAVNTTNAILEIKYIQSDVSSSNSVPAHKSREFSPKLLSPKMSQKTTPRTSPRMSPRTSPKTSSPLRNVVFSIESGDEVDSEDEIKDDQEA
ncbi:hypothetical protein BGX28_009097 [Mortierella sp. GBA30]|nr:hypothetical protein BGX28_009097 [Mortierella sp. GBA30]